MKKSLAILGLVAFLFFGCVAGIRNPLEEGESISMAGAGLPGSPDSTASLGTAVFSSACDMEITTARFHGFVCNSASSFPGVIEANSHSVSDPFMELGFDATLGGVE